jgi:HTH-type transcriptional regulator, sugar sensing transcriptional regulator
LSQEKVLEALEGLGLEKLDAQVYIFLGKRGPQKGKEIIKALKMSRQNLYPILKTLQNRGLVSASLEHPARFSAMPFEKALDLFVEAKMEEAQQLQRGKAEILSNWKKISVAEISDQSPRFTIIAGRKHIYPRLKQMIEDTKNQLSIITTVSSLVRSEQFGLIDVALDHFSETTLQFRFLTELTEENLKALKGFLLRIPKIKSNFQLRSPTLNQKSFSRMFIRDEAEVAFFIDNKINNKAIQTDDLCLWTDCKEIVSSFSALFEDLWRDATDIQKRIIEIETGKPPHRTVVIKNADEAQRKYKEIMSSAQKSIYMITSSSRLIEFWNNKNQIDSCIQKGGPVKIMAPITNENLEATEQLMKICQVKHIPEDYVETTIIDNQHLFQFNTQIVRKETMQPMPYFENTIYTDDAQYIEKTKNMLNNIWRNASIPSTIPLGSRYSEFRKIVGWIEETEQTALTEKDVLNTFINLKKTPITDPSKDLNVTYFSAGLSVIHPPAYLNLPDMIIIARHFDKQSSIGAEDMLDVYLWLETPTGHAYVTAATVGDNPAGVEYRKKLNAGTPVEQFCHLVKEDEIQVRLHGNTLFVGWSVPIPLYPPPFVLPPACLLFEGYGELKTGITKNQTPAGHTHIAEFNGFDAFVTFFHPASKYSGPGTDGFLRRDVVMTSYPPK